MTWYATVIVGSQVEHLPRELILILYGAQQLTEIAENVTLLQPQQKRQ